MRSHANSTATLAGAAADIERSLIRKDFVRRLISRRDFTASLNDHTLNDIGLTRGDVRWASQRPFHFDVTNRHYRLAPERRFSRGQRLA